MFIVESKEELNKLIEWLETCQIEEKEENSLFFIFLATLYRIQDSIERDNYPKAVERSTIYDICMTSIYKPGFLSDIVVLNKRSKKKYFLQKIHYNCSDLKDIKDSFFEFLLEGFSGGKIKEQNGKLYPRYVFERLPMVQGIDLFKNVIYMDEGISRMLHVILENYGITKTVEYEKYKLNMICKETSFGKKMYQNDKYAIIACHSEGIFPEYHIRSWEKKTGKTIDCDSLQLFSDGLGIGMGGMDPKNALDYYKSISYIDEISAKGIRIYLRGKHVKNV